VSLITIPYTFVAGTEALSAQVNANFSEIATVVNGELDNTNINSSVGIYASQIIPTSTAQATFGGAYGYVIAPGVTTQVPLTITGAPSQTANLFNVSTTTGPAVEVYSSGTFAVYRALLLQPPASAVGTNVVDLFNDGAATNGLILNVPTGSTNGFQFQTAGSTVASIAASGAVATGALTVTGQIKATTSIVAGSATAGTATAGDVWASRSTTTGALQLGGSSSNAQIDYGVTTPNTITFSAPVAFSQQTAPITALNPSLGYSAILTVNISGGPGVGAAILESNSGKGIGFFSGSTYVASIDTFGGILPGNGTSGAGTSKVFSGTGAPTINAPNASIYLRYDGTPGTSIFYINTSGASTTGTSWTAKF
jgi:hypothetical protein